MSKRQPQWIKCASQLPKEDDADCEGDVWVFMPVGFMGEPRNSVFRIGWDTVVNRIDHLTHWMPTGLKRPASPKMEGCLNE